MEKVSKIVACVFSWASAADFMKMVNTMYENGLCEIEADERDIMITFYSDCDYKKALHETLDCCLYDGLSMSIYKGYADIYTKENAIEIQKK